MNYSKAVRRLKLIFGRKNCQAEPADRSADWFKIEFFNCYGTNLVVDICKAFTAPHSHHYTMYYTKYFIKYNTMYYTMY